MLARIRKAQEENEGGFTLIELLVVIIIIGILAAIAIPVFLNQRKKGYDASAKSDLRNTATLEETYLTDYNTYGSATAMNTVLAVKTISNNNSIYVYTKGSSGYCLAGNNSGSSAAFSYDSANGGLNNTPAASLSAAQAVCTTATYVAAGQFVNTAGTIAAS